MSCSRGFSLSKCSLCSVSVVVLMETNRRHFGSNLHRIMICSIFIKQNIRYLKNQRDRTHGYNIYSHVLFWKQLSVELPSPSPHCLYCSWHCHACKAARTVMVVDAAKKWLLQSKPVTQNRTHRLRNLTVWIEDIHKTVASARKHCSRNHAFGERTWKKRGET